MKAWPTLLMTRAMENAAKEKLTLHIQVCGWYDRDGYLSLSLFLLS